MLKRYYDNLQQFIVPGKVLVLYGPRRAGKTTLLKNYLSTIKEPYRFDRGDSTEVSRVLSSQSERLLSGYAEGYGTIVIDEAQGIPGIGQGLKLLIDSHPAKIIIATGSSNFELAGQVGEPLTGRKQTLVLWPLAQLELLAQYNRFDLGQKLEEFLIYGSYPEVLTAGTRQDKIAILRELAESYVLKDVLSLERIKGSQVIVDLIRLVAFQIGHEVSHHELAIQVGLDVKTVGKYLDLLEKSFVLTRLGGFSGNLRKEVRKKHKYYFIDLGVRNAFISQFNSFESRNDSGQLWENFLVVERLKKRSYKVSYANAYFWRTYDKQEVDLVEEQDGVLHGFEFKWKAGNARAPNDWARAYVKTTFEVVDPSNYLDFVL